MVTESPYFNDFEILWTDVDPNQHARNTTYIDFGTNVRLAYLSSLGFPPKKMISLGFGPIVLREEIFYLKEVLLGDKVRVDFLVSGLSPDGARWQVVHHVTPVGKKQCSARIVVDGGWVQLATRKLHRPPKELAAAVNSLFHTLDFQILKGVRGNVP